MEKEKLALIFILSLLVFSTASAGIMETNIPIRIGGTSNCYNNASSCGPPGYCLDIRDLKYCVNGKVVEAYCDDNVVKNRTRAIACKNTKFRLNITNTLGIDEIANFTFISLETNNPIKSYTIDGLGEIELFKEVINLKIDYDETFLSIRLRNLNITKLDNKTLNIILDIVTPNIEGTDVYKAYRIDMPNEFSFSSATLDINYSDLGVMNESKLLVYSCGDYDFENNTCNGNWSTIKPTIDKNNKIVSVEVSHFSVYAIGSPEEDIATTTTTSTTSTTTTIPNTTIQPTTTTISLPLPPSNPNPGISSPQTTTTTSTNSSPSTTTTTSTTTTQPTTPTTSTLPENKKEVNSFTGFSLLAPTTITIISISVLSLVVFFLKKTILTKHNFFKPYNFTNRRYKPFKKKTSKNETILILD